MYAGLDSVGLAEALVDEAVADTALNDDALADIWDSWSSHWDREFSRLRGLEEQWKKRGAERILTEVKREAEYVHVGEAARLAREAEEEVEEMRRVQARQRLCEDANQGRKQAAADAFESADDLVREISENAAQRRLANEARRRKEREAAREAQWRRYHEPPKPPPAAHSGTASASAPSNGARPPPRARSSLSADNGPPSARPPPVRFTSFAEFDAYWSRFESRVNAGARDLHFIDVPWPTSLVTISGVGTNESLEMRKRKLRAALVRWHPDKWAKVLDCIHESDRAQVVDKVKEVTRRIIEEKKRHGTH
jgi:hypothetical protein